MELNELATVLAEHGARLNVLCQAEGGMWQISIRSWQKGVADFSTYRFRYEVGEGVTPEAALNNCLQRWHTPRSEVAPARPRLSLVDLDL